MIIKGGAAGNTGWWAKHLQRDDTNDRATLMEASGLLANDLPTALKEMEAIAAQSRSRGNFMYQANINPEAHERLTEQQWKEAVDTLENFLGLSGHQRIVVEHEKEGRVHRHVIWNRVDVETLRVTDIGGNYYTHERVARHLELKFDLHRTASLHGERHPEGRPDRPAELWEHRAAERSGIDPAQVKAEIGELWRSTDSGKAFAAAVAERGYILARGDRRDFCLIDQAGDVHSLARRIEGVKAANVRERMADIDRDKLPTVEEARRVQREAQATAKPKATQQQAQPKDKDAASKHRAAEQEARDAKSGKVWHGAQARREARQEATQAAWRQKRDAELDRVMAPKARTPVAGGFRVAEAGAGIAMGLVDFAAGILDGRASPPPLTPAQQIAAERRALAALQDIGDDMAAGRDLKADAVRCLTPTHLENIKLQGDDYLRQIIARMERDRTRERDNEREWER